jgi:hypothetical protein
MKARLLLVTLLGFGFAGMQAVEAAAAPTDASRSRTTTATIEVAPGDSYVSVVTQPTGEPILAVRYPWKRHARPSVEVRIVDDTEIDDPLIRPLFFVHDTMAGAVTQAVYECQERSDDVAQTGTFSENGIKFDIFGSRNSLGRPSVCVASRKETRDQPPETRGVFCLLDAWAVDRRTLFLELPGKYFSKPAKIRVWFLRGKDVVWTAVTEWPGLSD